MSETPVKTRFAPSPTGNLHLGNLRTALFSALHARSAGGCFLLRIEDTDAERSRAEFTDRLQDDLRWLGLDWQEGPGVEGAAGPYHQSERGAIYADYYARLFERDLAYPCFCTQEQLAAARASQRAAGRPPRYPGTCAHLSRDEAEARRQAGEPYTLRFRVPQGETVAFEDLVRGHQAFDSGDIGDFVIRRTDGTPAFFFCNAVDDALMGVTHVWRGEDHISNTPRQLLLLRALGLREPRYGHLALIVGEDGAPLSKRHGATSLGELRERGYLAAALNNYLARLGHSYADDGLLDMAGLAAGFDPARLGRAAARFDLAQLDHWQRLALAAADEADLLRWSGAGCDAVPAQLRSAFLAAIRDNVSFPDDVRLWAQALFADPMPLDAQADAVLRTAPSALFDAALATLPAHAGDFRAWAKAIGMDAGVKGRELFMPLRAALTGQTHGPEMARVFPLMDAMRIRERLRAAAGIAAG
ncbi:glutamate--tRNA ligase [Acidihalobacter prosperus]